MWSWVITYLPTTMPSLWLYLYLVNDVWSRKDLAWDVAEREDHAIAAGLVSLACMRERIFKGRRQPPILYDDHGNAMRAATLESRLEELGLLRPLSRPRCPTTTPTQNHCSAQRNSGLTIRTIHSRAWTRPVSRWQRLWTGTTTGTATGARFVSPHQSHNADAVEICRQRASIYELARQENPRRWSRFTRFLHQP